MGRGTDGPNRPSASSAKWGRRGSVCKRGLTRDACPGEAITRWAAGAAHERGTTLALPPCPPPHPHHRDPPFRATVPTPPVSSPQPVKCAPKSPSGGVEPPRRLNLPASASNPTLCRTSLPSSPSASTISIGSISLVLFRCRVARREYGKKIPCLSVYPSLRFPVANAADAAEQPLDPFCLIPCPAPVGYSGPQRAPLQGTVITPHRGTTTADKTRRGRCGAARLGACFLSLSFFPPPLPFLCIRLLS